MLTTKLLSQEYSKKKKKKQQKNWQQHLRSSMGDIMIWSIPTMWQFPELFLMFLPMTSHKQTSKIPDIRFYLYFLRLGGRGMWWAKLAYQVMLTIRGRLITPFILGSKSVGLNILIHHSFTDL